MTALGHKEKNSSGTEGRSQILGTGKRIALKQRTDNSCWEKNSSGTEGTYQVSEQHLDAGQRIFLG